MCGIKKFEIKPWVQCYVVQLSGWRNIINILPPNHYQQIPDENGENRTMGPMGASKWRAIYETPQKWFDNEKLC